MTIRARVLTSVVASVFLFSTTSFADDNPAPSSQPHAPPPALVVTQQGVSMTPAFEQQRVRLTGALRPDLRTRLVPVAASLLLRMGQPPPPNTPAPSVTDLARMSLAAAGFQGADVDTLVMIVMMMAAKETEQETKELLADIKATNAAKKCLRELPSQPRDARVDKSALLRECVKKAVPDVTPARLAAISPDAASLDSHSQQTSSAFMTAEERARRLGEVLSHVMKKMSDTSDSIVANMK